jgi:hypothetical protein
MARTKRVNGVDVPMTPQEEADFEASLVPTLAQAKTSKRNAIVLEWDRRDAKNYIIDVPGNITAYQAQTLANARALKAAVDAATTLAEVTAIDEKAGWP